LLQFAIENGHRNGWFIYEKWDVSIVFCMFTRPGNANSIPEKKKTRFTMRSLEIQKSNHQKSNHHEVWHLHEVNTHEITMKYRLYILQNPSNPCEFSKITTMKYPHSITMILADLSWFINSWTSSLHLPSQPKSSPSELCVNFNRGLSFYHTILCWKKNETFRLYSWFIVDLYLIYDIQRFLQHII
jgi:hypothetical protein